MTTRDMRIGGIEGGGGGRKNLGNLTGQRGSSVSGRGVRAGRGGWESRKTSGTRAGGRQLSSLNGGREEKK